MLLELITVATQSQRTPMVVPGKDPDVVIVYEEFHACQVPTYEHTWMWTRDGDGYRFGDRWITQERIEALRKLLLASNRDTPDLLTRLGITPESLQDHQDAILQEFEGYYPQTDERNQPIPQPQGLDEVLRFRTFSQHVLDHVLGQGLSTTHYELRVTLPGDPLITVSSQSRVGWMIPWEIEAEHRIWSSSSIDISKALAPFVQDASPLHWLIDGRPYWSEYVWKNPFLLMDLYFDTLPAAHQVDRYADLPAYEKLCRWFHVDQCWAGSGGFFSDLSVLTRSSVDQVRWWNPVTEKTPPLSWDEFLLNYDDAADVVKRCTWIEDWRRAGRDHRVCLHLAGKQGFTDGRLQSILVPQWREAGLPGEPRIEVWLQRGTELAGKVFLSHAQPVALIVFATPGEGGHWFDGLDVAFHPRAPTCVRVDASGRWESRTGTPDPSASARTHFSIR